MPLLNLPNELLLLVGDLIEDACDVNALLRVNHRLHALLTPRLHKLALAPKPGPVLPLCWAVWHGHKPLIRLLLDKGQNVEDRDPGNGETALHYALNFQLHVQPSSTILSFLLNETKQPNTLTSNGISPLHRAVVASAVAPALLLLTSGADVNQQAESGDTPLARAVEFNLLEMSALLLSHGADPNIPNRHGFPALSIAIREGYIAAAKLLLEHGADPSLLSPGDGQTPLHQAVAIPNDELVCLLLAHDPTIVDTPNMHGHTPLDHAIMLGCSGAARALLDNGADMNAVDSRGDTVLHRALNFCPRRGAMIRLLVEAGADFCSARNARGQTALDVATIGGYSWVLETCKEFINGRTPSKL